MTDRAPFGRTGHESSRVIFGAAALGSMRQERAERVLVTLLEFGVNQIDTAASYGDLDISGHWWRPFSGTQTIVVQAIGGPARPPSGRELWSLSGGCRIVEVQTATGTLGCATLGHRLTAMLVPLERGQDSAPHGPDDGFERSHAYDVTDTDGSRPDRWDYLSAYGWKRDDGEGIDRLR